MSATSPAGEKPYKGPLSYEIEDAAYFFGREREAELLLAKILSSRVALLHAQSGAGKTSLLNAKVIPGLEQQGWTAIRILARGNPSEAVRMGVLLALLPPPAAERAALDRTLELLWEPAEDPSIGEILDRFDRLHEAASEPSEPNPACRQALRPMDSAVEIKSAGVSFTGTVRPLFLRLLRETLEISQYNEHLQALVPDATLTERTPASELRRILDDPHMTEAHEQLLADLYVPSPSLLEFFTNLHEQYGSRRTQFGMVLLLDQFEELFTLFTDSPDAPDQQRWRLRWEFIGNLESLYEGGATLPLRYVISMRDEYIAQLDAVRRFVRDLDASSFHLSFLEKDEARFAIQEPAKLFNYTYSDECYQNILDALVREDRFVEPAPLQIVCERLWRDRDRAIAADSGNGPRVISLATFPTGGTRAILDSFFDEVIDSLPDAADRTEALDMLEPLVTSGGTRNIIARDSLLEAPFRNVGRRRLLLDTLTDARVVRIEQRLGGQFVEISHEFLIGSILAQIRDAHHGNPEYGQFRSTLRSLERFSDIDFRGHSSRLPGRHLFEAVHKFRRAIDWESSDWAVDLMLRSAVVHKAAPDTLKEWLERYSQTGDSDSRSILTEARLRGDGRSWLSLEELAIVNAHDASAYSGEQIEFVLRSQIQRGSDRHRTNIMRWAKELKAVWDRETRS